VKSSNKLFIFTGVALALVAVLMAITMSSGGDKADAQKQDSGKIKVVKAAVDLEPFAVLSMADVVVEEIATDQAPADAATDVTMVLGQAYKPGAIKGDILRSSMLQAPGISNTIEAGKRAVSLQVDTQGMMSGLIMDGDYVDVVFKARVDLKRVLQITADAYVEEDGPYAINNSIVPIKDGVDGEPQAVQGAPGSQFTVYDGGQNLEPVAKILVQDVKVIRVVAPGVRYDGQGQEVQRAEDETTSEDDFGQLILEVTPEQAEVLTFIQDQNHSYEITVRAEGDHEIANTSGITFEILITDENWGLPYPKPVAAPSEGQGPSEDE
jgi:Flp pilus assembly protein CpaB